MVIAAWVIVGFALFQFQPKLQEATTNENEAFLPGDAESTEVNDLVEERFADGREVDILVALHPRRRPDARPTAAGSATTRAASPARRGAASSRDTLLERRSRRGPDGHRPLPGPDLRRRADRDRLAAPAEAAPEDAPAAVSADGSTALLLIRTNTEDSEEIQDNVAALREIAPDPDAGEGELRAYVTGIGGIVSDSIEVFESIDTTLLLVTVGLVLVLLLAIYRSPVIALVPLFVVAIAYGIAAAARLRPGRGRGARGQRPDDQPADRPDVRRRHRLLPADRLPLPRGAATVRGQARGDGACDRAHRAGDPLGRRDRDRRDAGAHACRLPRHPDDGTGAGARRRGDAARRASPSCPRCWRRSGATPSGRRSRATAASSRLRSGSGAGSGTSSTSARRSRS